MLHRKSQIGEGSPALLTNEWDSLHYFMILKETPPMKLWKRVAVAAAFLGGLCISSPANAQIGLYANFSAAKLNLGNTDWVYGPGFGGYIDHGHLIFLSTGLDARGVILGAGQSTSFDAGYIGPRVAFRPHVLPIKPYVEALAGVGRLSTGATDTTKFSYQFVGGVDYTLIPRIDWRVAEFSYGGLSIFDTSLHPKTISTGIVVRLPGFF